MMKSIASVLNADVLYALRSMGMATTSCSAIRISRPTPVACQTALAKLLRMDNVGAGRAPRAILLVLPLDSFDKPALRMEIMGQPNEIPGVQAEVQKEVDAEGRSLPLASIERFAFYECEKVLLRGPDPRTALLWLLHLQEGRDPA